MAQPGDGPNPTLGTTATVPKANTGVIISQIESLTPQEEPKLMSDGKFDADVIVIGAGPGGYVAAIKAAQLGASVICVEKSFLGGTCLNVGCIPSKVWIASVERLQHVRHAADLGVKIEGKVEPDFDAMKARVEKIVKTQRGGVEMLFKKNGVKHVQGFASFVDKNTIQVEKDGSKQTLRARNFIIAGGSSVMDLPIPGLKGGVKENIWTSDDSVYMPFIPKSVLVIGGGAVGVEFAYVFNGLGAKTTVVEMMPNLIPMFDEELGVELGRSFKKQGVEVICGAMVEKAEKTKDGWKCSVKVGGSVQQIEAQVVMIGVGRKANFDGMNVEKAGVRLGKRGIEVANDMMQTAAPNIYAVGDVIAKIQLAHVASMEGIVAAENCVNGPTRHMDYKAVPNCVYTIPEVASVGLTEAEARAAGHDVVVGKYRFLANGKAMANAETEGFAKVVAEKKYGELLGLHIIGPHATDLIHEGVTAIKLEATLDYMTDTIHAHPTLAEPLLEAFESAAHGKSIHTL
jgi:dihydrolipoamide dehydrogenase